MQCFFYIYKLLCNIKGLIKGFEMIKNAKSLLEKFEESIEFWANRFF